MIDVENILEEKLQENQHLEYKNLYFENGKFNSLGQKQRNTLAKEICSFANSEGGDIVIGISEDEKHNPVKPSDTGVNPENFERWEQSFRLFSKSKIRPVIHGLKCNIIKKEDVNIISIEVPKSILKPHAFYDGNKDEFFIRYGNVCNHMSFDDLKKAFIELDSIQSKILSFRDNRISMILNDGLAGDIEDKAILALHIIPNWSMGINNYIDFKEVRYDNLFDVFSPTPMGSGRRGSLLYNTDGIIINYGYGEFPIMSYTQLFHNGVLESIEVRMMNYEREYSKDKDKYIYNWNELEEILIKRIYDFCKVLEKNTVPKPYNIFVSILNAKDKKTIISPFNELSNPLTKNIIKSMTAYINENQSFKDSIYPLLTSLAHSFGLERSYMYNNEGEPIEEKFNPIFHE